MKISEYTMSAWTPILRDRKTYLNSNYSKNFNRTLQINSNQIQFWKNYYCRHIPDYQPTDSVSNRRATLSNFRNRFISNQQDEESSQQRIRAVTYISGTKQHD